MKTTNKGLKRKALREVQPSAEKQSGLAVADGVVRLNFLKNQKKPAFDGPENAALPKLAKTDCHEAPPETTCDAYDLMVAEPAPADYWKQLAEQRRIALEEALKENEQLHDQVELLTAENKHLQTIADQALPLAELLKELTGKTVPSPAD